MARTTVISPRKKPFAFTVLGWVLGGLSLLNLIRDLTPMELYGLLLQWSDAYDAFVAKIGNFILGWINWRWITVDDSEYHVILLSVLVASALAKADFARDVSLGRVESRWASLIAIAGASSLVTVVPIIVIALLFANPFGAIVGLFGIIFNFVFLVGPPSEDDDFVTSGEVRRALLPVLACVILLIVSNYVIFR